MADYGWDAERERSFGPSRDEGLVPGRAVRAERGLCDVVAETGPVRAMVLPSSGTGDRLTPCTGDWVSVRPAGPATSATVVEVLERRTAPLARREPGRRLASEVREELTTEPAHYARYGREYLSWGVFALMKR
ncbi:hypothetical protein SGRI78S_06589 [Streptomyces griseus subsp. griseus]